MTDADLVARARQGDAAAFGDLVDRHRTAVYRAALAALGSHAEAEDAAQDAFLTAYRRLDGFRGEASFKTWLLTIAWHHAINRRRTLSRIWRRTFDPASNEDDRDIAATLPSAGPSPEQAVAHSRLYRAVVKEVRGLPPKLRDALVLAQSGTYTYEEIGAMLRVPVGTIKWRVSEARRVVRQRLRTHGYDDVAAG